MPLQFCQCELGALDLHYEVRILFAQLTCLFRIAVQKVNPWFEYLL